MAEPPIRLGTRGSTLALAQARSVAVALGGAEIVEIVTSGDGGQAPGDKSRFTKEIDEALLAGEVDIAVHSAKDVPAELPGGLAIAGVPPREDPSDCFVGPAGSLAEIGEGARIGTSSLRRRSQLLALRADLIVEGLRGNVDTRLEKVGEVVDGAVLATAGLRRLGRDAEASFRFPCEELTPAAGQGALALAVRAGDDRAIEAIASLNDRAAEAELRAERAAVGALEASCHTPVGILARAGGDSLEIAGYAGLPDGSEWIRDRVEGAADEAEALGGVLAERMSSAGAAELLQRAALMADAGSVT
jgi:hydroxymethylbilane synthase